MTPWRCLAPTLLVSLALAACGASSTTATTGADPATTAPATTAPVTAVPPSSAGNGSTSSSVLPPPGPTTTKAPRPTTPRPRGAPPVVIQLTLADDNTTVAARVGDSVHLVFDDPAYQWTNVKVTPEGLLTGVPLLWTAAHPGTATVTAIGSLRCPAPVACPMRARLFTVTLTIS